jgi:hypothetical protein
MYNTSKPKLTMANNGSMKALERFIQLEMREHDYGEKNIFLLFLDASDLDACKELNMQWI